MTAVRHTVAFALPYPADSDEEAAFLADARRLATIPGVEGFTVLRAEGAELPLALSMEFADRDAYAAYDADPLHRDFVQPSLIAPDLTTRLAVRYERLTGRPLDHARIGILSATHRLWELGDPEMKPDLLDFLTQGVIEAAKAWP